MDAMLVRRAARGGGLEVVEPVQLVGCQLDGVRRGVLLDQGDATSAGDRSDVLATGQQPRQRGLRGGGAVLGSDRLHLVGDREVAGEVVAGESGVGLAPVVVGEVGDGADLPGEQAVAEGRVGDEADAELAQQRQDLGLDVAGRARRMVSGPASDRPMCRIFALGD
jgi:hypothetical protein